MKALTNLVLLVTFFSGMVLAEEDSFTFSVKHDHFWGSGTGELVFTPGGIIYRSEDDEQHAREWTYEDIQEVKVASPEKVEILTYEDVRWKLNADRKFNFEIVNAEISPQVVQFLRQHATSGVVSAVFAPSDDIFHTGPAKHRHALGGGCRGELRWGAASVSFRSQNPGHSREWTLHEIESLGRMSRQELRITVREGGLRNFQFQLMEPLDPRLYQQLWSQIYEPESWLPRTAGAPGGGP